MSDGINFKIEKGDYVFNGRNKYGYFLRDFHAVCIFISKDGKLNYEPMKNLILVAKTNLVKFLPSTKLVKLPYDIELQDGSIHDKYTLSEFILNMGDNKEYFPYKLYIKGHYYKVPFLIPKGEKMEFEYVSENSSQTIDGSVIDDKINNYLAKQPKALL